MKKLFLAVAVIVLSGSGLAQAAGIPKYPGDPVTITWTNPATDDTKVTGWRIYVSSTASGAQTLAASVTASLRQATLPANFQANSVTLFFRVRSFFANGTATTESSSEPASGVEVDLAVPIPVGVQGK